MRGLVPSKETTVLSPWPTRGNLIWWFHIFPRLAKSWQRHFRLSIMFHNQPKNKMSAIFIYFYYFLIFFFYSWKTFYFLHTTPQACQLFYNCVTKVFFFFFTAADISFSFPAPPPYYFAPFCLALVLLGNGNDCYAGYSTSRLTLPGKVPTGRLNTAEIRWNSLANALRLLSLIPFPSGEPDCFARNSSRSPW